MSNLEDKIRSFIEQELNDLGVAFGSSRGIIVSDWEPITPRTAMPRCTGLYELRAALRRPSRDARGTYVGIATGEHGFQGRLNGQHTTLTAIREKAARDGHDVYFRLIRISAEGAKNLEGRKTRRYGIGPVGEYKHNRQHGRGERE